MSLVSYPIPSYRHYLLAWLRCIECNLPGCLQGGEVSMRMFEACNAITLDHGVSFSYADDIVLVLDDAGCNRLLGSPLP